MSSIKIKEKVKEKMENAAIKNMVRGTFFAGIYVVSFIIIPFLLFSWMMTLEIEDIPLELYKDQYAQIIFYLLAFGLLTSAAAFFTYSSPPQSIRRGILSIMLIIINCLYIWSYRFSGAFEIEIVIVDLGIAIINVQQMILILMGIYFLRVFLRVYDLIDFIVNRDKIKFRRGK